ncbi:hypothetical protein M0Q50_00490 [bacterium]|nr:hypothetical protein [bacterium]
MPEASAEIKQMLLEKPSELQDDISSVFFFSQGFKIWKTIKIGDFKDWKKAHQKLEKAGIKNNILFSGVLEKIPFVRNKAKVDIMLFSLAELGLDSVSNRAHGVEYEEICERAKQLGLLMCPAEVGLQLRLQYKKQPLGEWIVIAMEPIIGSDNEPKLFIVGRNNIGLWLNCDYYNKADDFWSGERRFAFVVKKWN